MPIGLKNVGETYQQLVNTMFEGYIGKIMKVYVDDMLVKSVTLDAHVAHLVTVLDTMIANGMRLNPEKCVFMVRGGKFLGFMVSERGIEANPEKLKPSTTIKEQATTDFIAEFTPPKTLDDMEVVNEEQAIIPETKEKQVPISTSWINELEDET
ncbi:hypothetical protein ACLB2K_056305 [Fragaria x ananassa]